LGQIAIRKMRDQAKPQFGPNFDIKFFHEEIRNGAAMSLNLLQKRVATRRNVQGPARPSSR
jgi:uncharacterized protein (DUF885 family)